MATPTVATYGGVTFIGPYPSTSSTEYFATSTTDSGAVQMLERWHYTAQHGQRIKRMGLGARNGTITGWLDGSTTANVQAGKTVLDALVAACTPGNLVLAGNTISDVVVSGVTYGSVLSYGSRYALKFVITWERAGGG